MPETVAHGNRWQNLTAKGVDELKRFLVMFLYLWMVFGLFVL